MTTSNTVNISEITLDQNDATKTATGQALATQYYFVIANGTDAGETFDAADVSAGTKTLMATYGRGVAVNMGGGDDTVIGSAYGDTISAGDGTNYVDGGDNQGTQPGGAPARDVLNVYAASQAAADALSVTQIDASATGADGDAYAQGYRIKVSNGAETDYLKNVEQVNVFVTAGSSYDFAKTINLAVNVTEADGTQALSGYMDLAWAHGTGFADTFNASTDISSATRALMDQHQRGAWVETGAGDDTITGSAYGDDINAGSGTNHVDGGGNAGSPPWGGKAIDTLYVTVADQAAAKAVQVVALAAGMSGADADAFDHGYTHKVVAGGETDYIKDIERVSVQVEGSNGSSTWARDIPLAVVVQEANLSDPAYANNYHLAWVTGTADADTIDASAGSTLLSSAVQAAMSAGHHGVYIDGGAGNDTITGSAYADNFVNGAGNSKIDGGANAGANGQHGMDMFQVTVASTAEMDAVTVSPSDDPDYQWMVTYGADSTQKDYLKNVEALVISVDGTSTGKWIPLAVSVNEIQANGDLANSLDYAWAQGTAGDDNFNAATDVSGATRALMDQHQRGVWVDLGAGSDTIVGSGYGDDISAGSGTNYVDGGANAGSPPWGGKAADTLHVTVADQAAAAAVQVVALAAGMAGADADAFANGYAFKVVAGAETDYIKDIERVSVQVDTGNGSSTWARDIPLTVMVQEANLSDPNIAQYYQLAWVNGTANADTIDASTNGTLLSSAVQAAMASSQRGVWIDGGDGNDTITGSAYADNFRNGAGNDKIDGGANASASGHGMDVFEVKVADSAALAALHVAPSDDPDYQWMVTYGAGSTQKDYLKNIEGISVSVADGSTYKWIPLAVTVNEANLSDPNIGSYADLAWVNGTAGNDTIDASAASPLLSNAVQAAMASSQRGVYIDAGAGNDTMVGTAYGDEFVPGTGTNHVDGGDNRGSTPWHGSAMDTVDMFVASQAEADAVKVTALAQSMTGDDGAAWAAGYRYKVTNGSTEIDYLKNVETVNISVWSDKNGDGARDYRGSSDAANEVTFVRSISLSANTAPTFGGAPAGVAVNDAGLDNTPAGGIVLSSGKMLETIFQTDSANAETRLVLTRTNADGSIDSSFGGGSGHVTVTASFDSAVAPLETADGKLLVAVGTGGSTSDFKVMRLNADGSLDASFGNNGSSVVSAGTGADRLYKIALAPDGKIVLVGGANGATHDMAVVRLNADGSPDTGFNGSGTLTLSLAAGTNVAEDVAFTKDGKMVVAGFAGASSATAQLALVRINADGTLDSGFGSGGKLTVPVSAGVSHATAVQALSDGKVLVAGYFKNASTGPSDPVLVRLNADGSTDATFGSGGMVKGSSFGIPVAMQVQPDGKILALSTAGMDSLLGTAIALTRYNADGSLDTGFGNGGATTVSAHGIGDYPASLALVGGKIVVFGSSYNDMNYDASNVIARLNADGSFDTSFGTTNPSSLGGTVRADGYHAVAIAPNASVYDAELVARGSYGGATLTLARHGGAGAQDQFSGVDDVSIAGGTLTVEGTSIGTVTQVNGKLTITFNSAATQGLVNLALHGIGYSNSSSTPPSQVTIDWNFSDGNDGSQGSGGAKAATGSTTVQIGAIVTEEVRSLADPSLSGSHVPLSNLAWMGQVHGTLGADSFDSTTGFTPAVHGLMDTYQRGALFEMGAGGGDTVKGTAWADSFIMGSGTNHVDGGGHASTGRGDSLEVYASSQANADATKISSLDASSTGADATAFAAGYTVKVVSGSETDYLKNIQQVDIWTWTDANGDKVRDDSSETTFVRSVQVALNVFETKVSSTDPTMDTNGNLLSKAYSFASVFGTTLNDSFNAATGISQATRTLMDQYHRGVYADLGAGNDTAVGSAYGDTIIGGAGVNHVDGGANDGADANGFAARDFLQVSVSTQAGGAGAVSAVKLTAAMAGADGQAYAAGYTWKVAAPGETDYIKNIEQVDVFTWDDANGNGVRDSGENSTYGKSIALAPQISEVAVSTTDPTKDVSGNALANYSQFAWVTGTAGDDVINGASGVSQATIGLMIQYKHGMSFDTGAGDDVVTGTDYGDWINGGAGTNKIDGGNNYGIDAYGNHMRDILTVHVTPQAPTVNVTQLGAASTGADHDAFVHGYTWKVSATGETDYVMNVEAVQVMNWNDANGNGQQDNGETTFNEIRLAPRIIEEVASAADPTKDASGNLLTNFAQFAWAYGTQGDDTINAANAVPQVQSLMSQYQRGMYFDTGAGNDTLTGTNYGDDFVAGPGVNRIDGFDNYGTDTAGQPARDVLEVFVASQAAADALAVTALTPAMTGDDGAAYAAGYRYKVANGSAEIDYVVNVEHVSVAIWNDANGNGQRDYSAGNSEVSFVRDITLGASNTAPEVLLAGPLYTNGVDPVRFDKAPLVYDADLAKLGSYAGATLTLARHGGANADDIFGASGNVSFANGVLSVANTPIGHVSNVGGVLTLHFETGATLANVDSVVYAITYANHGTSPSASLTIDWTFSDGNDGSQGSGGALSATGSTDVHIGMSTSEVARSTTNLTLSTDGHMLSDYQYLGSAFGTVGGDTVDASVFSSAARGLMDQYKHGASFNTYGGGDHVTGTAYGDNFQTGQGVNYVDGAANANGADWLHVVVSDKAALDAVQVTALAAGMQGADADAFAQGYTNKVVAGGETDYVKGIEAVNIVTSDGTFGSRNVALAVTTMEIGGATAFGPVARILGTQNTEVIDASGDTSLLSAAAKAEADSHGRGVYVETGGGNDTIIGTAHPDIIIKTGPGSTHVDGGDNIGPSGSAGSLNDDTFEVMVASAAAADAVSVVRSDDPNYQWMVTYGPGSTDKDYLKNIESVVVIPPDATSKGFSLTMNIGQVTGGLSKAYNIAFVEGTALDDHFNAGTDLSPTLSQALDTYQRGASIYMHDGDDVVVGTKYYDDINAGAGTNYVDGGGHAGTTPDGYHPGDSLHVSVNSQADLDAAQVTQLVAGMSGADADAFADGYEFKVTAVGETDYIKNIDHVFFENFAQDGSGTSRTVTLTIGVNELGASDAVTSVWNAYVSGTAFNDTFNAAVDVSPATQALMAQYSNGVHVDMGAGNDTVVGSPYGDDITVGTGVNYVDGGANANRGSNVAEDVLHITVGSQAEADAIAVITLNSSATGDDLAAFNAGYMYKIAAGNEIDYVTNVERYDVTVWDDQNHNGRIDSGESLVVADHQIGASPTGVVLVGVPHA